MSFQKIVCAIDLSENSVAALRQAIELSHQCGAALHVLHVMSEMQSSVVNYVASVIGEDRFADLELEHEAEVHEQLQALVEHYLKAVLGEDVAMPSVKVDVHHGQPVDVILKTVARLSADLVVLGSHGKGRVRAFLLGSVAEQVLQRLDTPALVVPIRAAKSHSPR